MPNLGVPLSKSRLCRLPSHSKYLSINLVKPWTLYLFPWPPPFRVIRNNLTRRVSFWISCYMCIYSHSWYWWTMQVITVEAISQRNHRFGTIIPVIPWSCIGTYYQMHHPISLSPCPVPMCQGHGVKYGAQGINWSWTSLYHCEPSLQWYFSFTTHMLSWRSPINHNLRWTLQVNKK